MNRRGFLKSIVAAIAAAPIVSFAKPKQLESGDVRYIDNVKVHNKAMYDIKASEPNKQYPAPDSWYVEFSGHVAEQYNMPLKCLISDVHVAKPSTEFARLRVTWMADYVYDIRRSIVLKDKNNPVSLQLNRHAGNERVSVMSLSVIDNRLKRVDILDKPWHNVISNHGDAS